MCLVPVRESRFTRSQLADIPASDRDSLDLRDPDGQVFTAATVALSLDGPIADGFAVVLVPSADDSGISYWHLFVAREGEVFVYRVRHSPYSSFDLRVDDGAPVALDPRDDASHRIAPITSWGLKGYVLSQPAAAIYAQQEEFVDPKGDSVSLLKGGRGMVAAVARTNADADTGVVAIVDFAIGADGQLARLGQRLDGLPSLPLGVALSFDGRNDRVLSKSSYTNYPDWYAQAWVRWRDIDAGSLRCVLATEDTAGTQDVSLSIDSDGKLVVEGHDSAGQATVWRTVRCVPRRRWTLVGVMAKAGYPPLCYVNNHPVMFEQGERSELVKSTVFMVWAGRLPNDSKGSALPFCGEMSDLRLYNATASNVQGEEVLDPDAAFQAGNLMMHWPFTEGTGSTSNGDRSNEGTITGAQWIPAGPPSQRSSRVRATHRPCSTPAASMRAATRSQRRSPPPRIAAASRSPVATACG